MKERISATVEPEAIKTIERLLKSRKYRNISHVIENAIAFLGEKEKKDEKKK